ncbi:MAG: hypothetical protein IKY31_05990 [Bacteroidaceae bacterium]|nr:hypothetical protein [Bacteroidaceae bacterium]
MKHTFCLVCLLICCTHIFGQSIHKGITYNIESSVAWSNGENFAPFWFTANRHGLFSTEANSGYLKAGLFRSTKEDSHRNWQHGFGIELAGAYNHTSSFIVQQAYYDIAWKGMQLSIGSKERPSALKNPLLSSGGLIFGTNARPVPQVRFELPEYVTIPGTNDWVHIKGFLGYGMYTDNNWQQEFVATGKRYTLNALHHVKAGYMKIGNEKTFPLYFEGALEMANQFGGHAYNVTWGRQNIQTNDFKIGSGFKEFFEALIPMGGDATDGETSDGESYANASGNHIGSWHFTLTYAPEDWNIRAYYEHMFDDHSMMFFEYGWEDGLYGIEVTFPKNPLVHTFLYEYMNSKDQAGAVYHDHTPEIPDQVSAVDNYYNHLLYPGWQHWGMGIGSPFILSPIYNTFNHPNFINDITGKINFYYNRVQTHHFGFCGSPTREIDYRLMISFSKHWGSYYMPLIDTEEQISAILEVAYNPSQMKGWQIKGSIGYDHGTTIIGNNYGGMLTVSKIGQLP